MKTTDETTAWSEGKGGSPGTLFEQMGHLGWIVHSDAVSRGDRAELRRMRPDEIPPEAYWRLTEPLDRNDELWMTVLPLMVSHPHERGDRPGRVLARAGVKPARTERWLRREKESAWKEAARFLGPARGVALDWSRFGTLLARWSDPERRRTFARDYFSELYKLERKPSQASGDA